MPPTPHEDVTNAAICLSLAVTVNHQPSASPPQHQPPLRRDKVQSLPHPGQAVCGSADGRMGKMEEVKIPRSHSRGLSPSRLRKIQLRPPTSHHVRVIIPLRPYIQMFRIYTFGDITRVKRTAIVVNPANHPGNPNQLTSVLEPRIAVIINRSIPKQTSRRIPNRPANPMLQQIPGPPPRSLRQTRSFPNRPLNRQPRLISRSMTSTPTTLFFPLSAFFCTIGLECTPCILCKRGPTTQTFFHQILYPPMGG